MPSPAPKIICVCGETGVGKTRVAIEIAKRLNGEIVNADSMQVYRGMDIGTAKPTPEEQAAIPFHCIDLADPRETYSAGRFHQDSRRAIFDIVSRGRVPVVAGGTGLYLKVLLHGIIDGPPIDRDFREAMKKLESECPGFLHERLRSVDPHKAEEIPARDTLRLIRALEVFESSGVTMGRMQKDHRFSDSDYRVFLAGIRWEQEALAVRIRKRVSDMIEQGFIEEVRRLTADGLTPATPSMSAVGYREIMSFLKNERTIEETVQDIVASTLRLAKRQRTWFRSVEGIRWYPFPEQEFTLIVEAAKWSAEE